MGGGVDSDGRVVGKPLEMARAEFILGMCERFGCLPSQLLAEDAGLMRMLKLETMGRGEGRSDDGG